MVIYTDCLGWVGACTSVAGVRCIIAGTDWHQKLLKIGIIAWHQKLYSITDGVSIRRSLIRTSDSEERLPSACGSVVL